MATLPAARTRAPPSSSSRPRGSDQARRVTRIVFFALVLDLLAFTMPLPLFPRIIDDFVQQEARATPRETLLSRTLTTVRGLRSYLAGGDIATTNARFDLTLLGGLLGSAFSFCQFVISPTLGTLSDRYGRKPVLMASMIGNLVSAALWLGSGDSFGVYAASRIVGGLSEGNVQLSIAAISDVTTKANRSKSLALVGLAFAISFTLGPSIGAYFASKDLFRLAHSPVVNVPLVGSVTLNSFAVPAAITLALLAVETLYLAVCLPETKGWPRDVSFKEAEITRDYGARKTIQQRRETLRRLEWVHFGFLFFFSGAEFTITFLTHNLFDFSNAQNGRLLGFIGILSSLLQGGYVRRASSTPQKTLSLAIAGVRTCQFSLLLLSSLPFLSSSRRDREINASLPIFVLYAAAAGLAFVSATVVNSLNSLASLETDEDEDGQEARSNAGIEKGQALGRFRSKGQLGRALGPLFATGVYWCVSPAVAYSCCAIGTMLVAQRMNRLRGTENAAKETERRKAE